jgi:hypothetical protein
MNRRGQEADVVETDCEHVEAAVIQQQRQKWFEMEATPYEHRLGRDFGKTAKREEIATREQGESFLLMLPKQTVFEELPHSPKPSFRARVTEFFDSVLCFAQEVLQANGILSDLLAPWMGRQVERDAQASLLPKRVQGLFAQ